MPANRPGPPPPPPPPSPSDPLSAYRAKRSLDRTPEPGSRAAAAAPLVGGLFVVHKHAATRLHWDLRLEMDGVLQSWAVPKGPSRDPADKRLAVHVEDHPIEYGDFEGIIPEGNYGAGAVIVWDRGAWVPIEDPHAGLAKGKLLFELKGYKLRGVWTLVKIKRGEKEWLLIKERDGDVKVGGDAPFPEESVLSGVTVEDLKGGRDRAAPIRKELAKLRAPERVVRAADAEPMLAETREAPFTKAGWLFELKLDGYRVRAAREDGEARLITRNGHDIAATFPELARAVAALPYGHVILDGELVVLDDAGHPSFQRLQNRAKISRALEVRRAAVESPATLYVFDLLAFEGFDARPLPLAKRKAVLEKVLPKSGPLKFSEHFETKGEALYEQVVRLGLEGIMAKKADSPYRAGRSPHWLKIRADRTGDFVVVGFTRPKGSRSGFGALQLAAYEDGKLTYAGRVGSGFTAKQLKEVAGQLEGAKRPTAPCDGPVPRDKETTWVEPALVVEVRYKEWTEEQLLRQPVFLRFRDDKPMAECEMPGGGMRDAERVPTPPPTHPASPIPDHEVQFSNLDKIFWPDEGYTKGDLIEYYRAVSPWLLPYLKDRPVVMTRYPDGITGKSFFQKDAPVFAPEWLRTERIWSEDTQRDIDYFVCNDVESLLYLINLGTIPLHVWGSRVTSLERPDWCILDLDPKDAPFAHVVTVAKAVKGLADDIDWPCFIKTSGSTGLHVLLPLARQCTYEQCRQLGGLLARVIATNLPEVATITRQVGKRGGRVYLDYVQNGHGRLLVAPFSVRPLPGAPVSIPLEWREVTPKLDIKKFTIKNAPARMTKLKDDPLLPVLEAKPDLVSALERLQGRLDH
ncbi:MAG: DNA ligase D [Gemmatimonadetes bacterium 13_1_40CM_70_11]|nr:MAG: DNA ligase D [Gemmatimonadetes bacterium 13_1_40CM_70_11]